MKRIVILAALGGLVIATGCERKAAEVHARTPASAAKTERIVTRWKESDAKLSGYGMILEQEGAKVTAALYRVEPGAGFVIQEKSADGKYFPDRKAIVFPLFMQGVASAEEWIAAHGPHLVVGFDAQNQSAASITNLTGELKGADRNSTYQFTRLPSEALPSILNTSHPGR